ncbi:MAG TPA: hypothetical protein VGK75_02360 [Casimicrobiaceae bacterium]|jgi:hypothetical protein
MNIDTRWTMFFAGKGRAAVASWLRRKLHNEKQVRNAELQEWENEGGNLAPSPAVPDTLLKTR